MVEHNNDTRDLNVVLEEIQRETGWDKAGPLKDKYNSPLTHDGTGNEMFSPRTQHVNWN